MAVAARAEEVWVKATAAVSRQVFFFPFYHQGLLLTTM